MKEDLTIWHKVIFSDNSFSRILDTRLVCVWRLALQKGVLKTKEHFDYRVKNSRDFQSVFLGVYVEDQYKNTHRFCMNDFTQYTQNCFYGTQCSRRNTAVEKRLNNENSICVKCLLKPT